MKFNDMLPKRTQKAHNSAQTPHFAVTCFDVLNQHVDTEVLQNLQMVAVTSDFSYSD